MSVNKRSQARVQGSWAAAGSQQKPHGKSGAKPASATDAGKPTFQPSERSLPSVVTKTISAAGTYDISTEPSGMSTLRLMPDFIAADECKPVFDELLNTLPWQQETVVDGDETYQQPRLTAWIGEHPYSYSGITHPPNNEWPAVVKMLMDRLHINTGLTFNSVLANLYRDGHDHVSWHADDEPALGHQPTIATLSFGDTRTFHLRKNPPPDQRDSENRVYTEYIKVPLDSGSLLIMQGAIQNDWQHRIPREYHDRGPRISLTFRVIYSELTT